MLSAAFSFSSPAFLTTGFIYFFFICLMPLSFPIRLDVFKFVGILITLPSIQIGSALVCIQVILVICRCWRCDNCAQHFNFFNNRFYIFFLHLFNASLVYPMFNAPENSRNMVALLLNQISATQVGWLNFLGYEITRRFPANITQLAKYPLRPPRLVFLLF